MRKVEAYTYVPRNLLELMNEGGIESAIIHAANLSEDASVMEAHQAGKKIVILKRDPPTTQEEKETYERLEQAGILTVEKEGSDWFEKALTCLSKLFEENTT